MGEPERAIRRHVGREHRDVVDGIKACAAAVACSSCGRRLEDGAAIRAGLRRELERSGLLERFPTVLDGAVAAAGFEPLAEPVPAPPYVVVTSRGPVLRAVVEPGRVVIRFVVFEVDRSGEAGYRHLDEVTLRVELR